MSPIRVLVVDDHALFRRGVVDILAEEPDIEVVGEVANGLEAIQRVADLSPHVVLMDLTMPQQGGIETTAYLTQRWPEVMVLVLTVSEEPASLFQALSVGARGYLVKTCAPRELVDAVRQVAQGWVIVSPSMAARFLTRPGPPHSLPPPPLGAGTGEEAATPLTQREREILQLVARSLTNQQIADALVISENTVKTHVKNVLGKLQAASRREAAAVAARLGLFMPGAEGSVPSNQ